MSARKSLGRGMLSLVEEHIAPSAEELSQIRHVDISALVPNRYQPRQSFDAEKLEELAQSIRHHGIVQPLIVTDLGDGRFELVAGERRLRAAQQTPLATVPVVVRDYSPRARLEIALVENIQREDLNPMEEAFAYQELLDQLELTQDQVAEKVGKSRSYIAHTLRLTRLPDFVQDQIRVGRISSGHARVILMMPSLESQMELTHRILLDNMSVREVEQAVQDLLALPKKETIRPPATPRSPLLEASEHHMTESLGLKVEVLGSEDKGRVQIHYASRDELEQIQTSLMRYRHRNL